MNAPVQPQIDINKRCDQYIQLRDKIKAIKKKHSEELAPYTEALEKLNGLLLQHLDAVGADNVGTAAGTVYRTLDDSASIADKNAFWTWVVTQGAWDMLDYKANVKAVRDHIAEQAELAKNNPGIVPAPPPGVNYTQMYKVGVRRA